MRRLAAVFTAALMIVLLGVGCGSDDGGSAPTVAAPGATDTNAGTGTLGAGITSLQDAQAQLCPELSSLEADLAEVSTSGTEAGQNVLAGLGSFAAAFEAAGTALTSAGADDAATAASDLAASLESLSTSSGEDAVPRPARQPTGRSGWERHCTVRDRVLPRRRSHQ